MKAVIYARYSTDRQSETSIADQVRVCRQYATRHGWMITAEYSDEGISGAAFGNRPGAQAAIAASITGTVLVVCDLTRLARSQELAPLMDRVRFRGGRVIGVQDGFDSDSPTARMQAGLSGIMSDEMRASQRARTHSALELRAEAGRPTGGKAYSDVAIIREIFARAAAGETLRGIANDLNRRAVPSPGAAWNRRTRRQDGRWLASAIHELLRNDRYAGRLIWNRSVWIKDPDTGRRLRRERPRDQWIVREIPAIVDTATWDLVQTRLKPRRSGRGGAPRYLLSGLLSCALCGCKMIVCGGGQHRYVCGSYHAGGEHACSNRLSVPRSIAEERILEPVVADLLAPDATAEALRQMRMQARQERPEAREVVELERLVRDGVLSAHIAAPALAEARRRATAPVELPTARAWRETVSAMREILQGEDMAAAREILRELLGDIRVRPQGDALVAELTARHVLLQTGTGRWVGSGGALLIHLPTSTRRVAALPH
jgi:site-specific DNA recombinase